MVCRLVSRLRELSVVAGLLAPALLPLLLLPGCGSQVQYVHVDSKPAGAVIYLNGEKKGVTPETHLGIDFGARPGGRVLLQLAKPRYRPVLQYWSAGEVPKRKVFSLEVD